MPAPSDFVSIAVQDIQGQPDDMNEAAVRARKESPSMAAFVDMAVKDLQGLPEEGKVPAGSNVDPAKIHENAEELRNAFARGAGASLPAAGTTEQTAEAIESFKKEADKESQSALEKILTGLR